MTAVLLAVLEGPRAGDTIEVAEAIVIGRSHADIIISDPELSRQHASIRPVAAGAEVDDLGSLNGTWIDGRRVTSPTVARRGAMIRVGATVAEILVEGSESGPGEELTVPRHSAPAPASLAR